MSAQQLLVETVARRIGIQLRLDATFTPISRFLSSRATELGLADAAEYIRHLAATSSTDDEWLRLVSVVTNGQTAFFRDRQQLDIAADAMVEVAKTRARPLAIWSAGCSTGEEVYSLAALSLFRNVPVRVLGTDINPASLSLARHGVYGEWSLRRLAPERRSGYLRKVGEGHAVEPHVASLVSFQQHNLAAEPWAAPTPRDIGVNANAWDLILCRNVFIYFDRALTIRVVTRLSEELAPHGWFFVGPGDALNLGHAVPSITPVGGRMVYRRTQAERRLPSGSIPPPRGRLASIVEESAPEVHAETRAATIERAYLFIDQGELDNGRKVLAEMLAKDPLNLPARISLGNVHLAQHRFEDAARTYAKAHDQDPLLPEIHFFQAVLHRKTGQLEAASEACRRALFLDPDFWPAASLRASILVRMGQTLAAITVFEQLEPVLAASPAPPVISIVAGMTGILPRPEEALAACRHQLRTYRRHVANS